MPRNRFKHGSACFKCRSCGKLTRDTGDNGDVRLCPLCNVKAGNGNSLSDAGFKGDAWAVFEGCQTERECDDLLTAELARLRLSAGKVAS